TDNPGQHGHDEGEQVRAVDQRRDRPYPGQVKPRRTPGPANDQAEDAGDDDGGREPGQQGQGAAHDRTLAPLVEAERHAHDRVVFRPDHHGPNHEDLGVGQDADRADQPGDDQKDVEAGGVDGVGANLGFDDLPHRGDVPLDQEVFRGPGWAGSERRIDLVDHDRALVVDRNGLQLPEHGVG